MATKPNPPKRQQPSRYNVHQTLANGSYQPANRHEPSRPEPNKPKKRFGYKKAALLLFAVILTPLLIIGVWDYRNASDASKKMFGTSNAASALLMDDLDSTAGGRVNILLAGYSEDDPEHAGALLTDSIMVLSMDKEDKTGYMLSIPRDLYVKIPDYGSAKINEAYQAGGIELLQKVVTDNFKIPLHYYAVINYAAVRDTTDALDGISVDIKSPDPRGLYDPNFKPEEGGPLTLTNGTHQIDGQTALKLTRARGATYGSYGFPVSDFNRTENQQKVLAAIKSELDWKLILDPRLNDRFFDAIANNVKTDLEISEVLPMLRLTNAVKGDKLRSVTLQEIDGVHLLKSYRTPNGQSALVPADGNSDFSGIQEAVRRLGQ